MSNTYEEDDKDGTNEPDGGIVDKTDEAKSADEQPIESDESSQETERPEEPEGSEEDTPDAPEEAETSSQKENVKEEGDLLGGL
ncbi:MAG: hypothetical protein SV377_01850, partial [Halobacteria archaeon]|nr:hypothetical protein [Halobacteria archaeon]